MKKTGIIYLVFLAFILASCSPQRKLATQFVNRNFDLHVLLLPPLSVDKKFIPLHATDNLATDSIDTSNLEESQFIKFAEDSVLIKLFMSSLRQNLEAFGVKVYEEADMDAFFDLDSMAFVFSLAQLEVTESFQEKVEMTLIDTTVYEIGLTLRQFTQSQWFEFTQPNYPERQMQVLYSSQFTNDIFEGGFRKNNRTGQMEFVYEPFRLRFDDLYWLSIFAGEKNAQFIFDFLLNEYIDQQLKTARSPVDYLQYDRQLHIIRPANNDRFIPIAIPESE